MDWNEATDLNIKTLRRIVALLLALAGVAERASGRCHAVRSSVLWLLRPGEVIVRDYVAALTGDPRLVSQPATVLAGDGRADAMRLALGFRMLAAALATFAEQMLATLQADPTHARRAGPAQCGTSVLASHFGRLPAVEGRDSS